jgi:BON domain
VNVTNGVVTLAGPVSTEEDRQRAEAAARAVEGVTSVNNNLQVTTTGVAAPPPGTTWPAGTPGYGTPPIAGTMPTTPLSAGVTPPAAPPMAMTPEMAMPPPTEAVPLMTTPPSR